MIMMIIRRETEKSNKTKLQNVKTFDILKRNTENKLCKLPNDSSASAVSFHFLIVTVTKQNFKSKMAATDLAFHSHRKIYFSQNATSSCYINIR